MKINSFKTHAGEIVSGSRLQAALDTVANWYCDNAYAIREQDEYASHVTEETKEQRLREGLLKAERIRTGDIDNLSIRQRIDTVLTGKCVALLP